MLPWPIFPSEKYVQKNDPRYFANFVASFSLLFLHDARTTKTSFYSVISSTLTTKAATMWFSWGRRVGIDFSEKISFSFLFSSFVNCIFSHYWRQIHSIPQKIKWFLPRFVIFVFIWLRLLLEPNSTWRALLYLIQWCWLFRLLSLLVNEINAKTMQISTSYIPEQVIWLLI